jgi:purine-nucleoside phosphorylase
MALRGGEIQLPKPKTCFRDELMKEINAAVDFLKQRTTTQPEIGLITGTGLGKLTRQIEIDYRIPYSEIPYFPVSTVQGHQGVLVYGRLANRSVIAMEGRFHLYEGYTPYEITFPVRVMSKLGIKYLLISSAAGGLNRNFKSGDLMIVTDHINFTGTNPLAGPNLDEFGPRFPDMSHVYDPDLINLALMKTKEKSINLRQGVYIGIAGPSLETPSETKLFSMMGADAIGMSTVHEVIAAVHCGLKIIAIMVITNINLPEAMENTSIENVIATADSSGNLLSVLWEDIITALPG